MSSLNSSDVATLAGLVTLFSVFGLAIAVQNQVVDATNNTPMPAQARRWLWRIELLLRLLTLAAVGLGLTVCLFALRAGKASPEDFNAAASLLAVLFIGVIVHAVARLALPRMWSPASEEHLAPRLRVDERDWAVGIVLVSLLLVSTFPTLIYSDRAWVRLLIAVSCCALLVAIYLGAMRAAHRSTAKSRAKRDDELKRAGLRLEPLRLTFADLYIETLIFRGKGTAFIDPNRAHELANNAINTRSFQDARGVDPDCLLDIRSRLLPRPVLQVRASTGDRRTSRLETVPLQGVRQRDAKLFRLDDKGNDLLKLLRAHNSPQAPWARPRRT